jgi:hypothetical protein
MEAVLDTGDCPDLVAGYQDSRRFFAGLGLL